MVRDVLRARASAEVGAHERVEDLKRSMIENMPPKGTIFFGFFSDFIRIFAILCFVSIENLFFFYGNTNKSEFSDTTKFCVTFCCSGF